MPASALNPRNLWILPLLLCFLPGQPAEAVPPRTTATVQEILDGNQLYIESRQARRRDTARSPERLRTGNSRGQLSFESGGAGRINRYSQLKLGSTCFLITQGQILVSGPQSGCTRSARLSVRGTNYLISISEGEGAELIVLEGTVAVEPQSDGAPVPTGTSIPVAGGNRVKLSSEGAILSMQRLTAAEIAAILSGPLFVGFTSPLPAQAALEAFLNSNYPELKTLLRSISAGASQRSQLVSSLENDINAIRPQFSKPPFADLPDDLRKFLDGYAQKVLSGNLARGTCDHDPAAFEALRKQIADLGYTIIPSSELLTCSVPTRDWKPKEIIQDWLSSPLHTSILFNRPKATTMGCSSLSLGGESMGLCTLWTPSIP